MTKADLSILKKGGLHLMRKVSREPGGAISAAERLLESEEIHYNAECSIPRKDKQCDTELSWKATAFASGQTMKFLEMSFSLSEKRPRNLFPDAGSSCRVSSLPPSSSIVMFLPAVLGSCSARLVDAVVAAVSIVKTPAYLVARYQRLRFE